MQLESPAFASEQKIPKKFTCEGEDVSPPLIIQDVPKNAKSLVIIVHDPDAPNGDFVHWLAWNLDPVTHHLVEGLSPPAQGRNDFGELDYRGPCPPKGKPHRYFFRVFALDTKLNLSPESSKKELEDEMKGHILSDAELMGVYQRG
jgi:Raf kinase inhibitor-like YbhB/YbcL family protein